MAALTPLRQPPAHSPLDAAHLVQASLDAVRFSTSALTSRLESVLRERFGADQVVLCGSGTQALDLAIRIGAGEVEQRGKATAARVALPAYGCFDLVTASVGAGAEISFYDVDPITLGPDPDSFREAARKGAEIAVVAPLYGFPVAWDELRATAEAHGVVLIEDAAQAAGGTWKGRLVGGLGGLTVLSFGRGKGWTGGGGGALLVRGRFDEGLVRGLASPPRHASLLSWIGSMAQWALGRPGLYGIPSRLPGLALGETHYHRPVAPSAPARFSLALTLATAESAWLEVETRRTHARAFQDGIGRVDRTDGARYVRSVPGADPGYLRFPVLLPGGFPSLPAPGRARALGIMPGYPRLLAELPAVRNRTAGSPGPTPGAVRLVRDLVTLPTHRYLDEPTIRALLHEVCSISR